MTPAMGRTAVVALGLLAAIGLTGDGKSRDRIGEPSASSPPPALSLVSFDDCHDLLAGLRTATKASAGRLHPGRLPLGQDLAAAAGAGAAVAPKGEIAPNAEAAARSDRQDAGYSRTNTRESDVDEPDVVKTDGTRI